MRLPGGQVLRPKQARLAHALAEEWQHAGGDGSEVLPLSLPLTRLTATAELRIQADRARAIEALAAYAASDLLCYRAEFPPALAARQAELWDPWLDWAADALGARLLTSAGVMPVAQPEPALAALRRALAAESSASLAALGVIVPALGSLVLGLAVSRSALAPEVAHALSRLDPAFQTEQWGRDAEDAARDAAILRDIEAASRFLALAADGA